VHLNTRFKPNNQGFMELIITSRNRPSTSLYNDQYFMHNNCSEPFKRTFQLDST